MKFNTFCTVALVLASTLPLFADDPKDAKAMTTPAPAVDEITIPISQEASLSTAYVGTSNFKQGSAKVGSASDLDSTANYVISPQVTNNVLLRFGANAENYSFGTTGPLLNTLTSYNAIIGADLTLSDKIIMRVEAHPGLYGDNHLSGDDFMVPVQIGGTYLYSKDLQFILGFEVNLDSSIPVIGIPGVRWQFADQWVLSAIPPKPQLQYLFSKQLTLYTGAEITGGTYRVSQNFGDTHGQGATAAHTLDSAVLDYAEIRLGAGTTYKIIPGLSLDVSGGYVPYRDMDFHRANTSYHTNIGSGAPYAEVGLSGSF